jgi:putative sigma-54 modulation protein
MKIAIEGRNLKLTPALKTYAKEKIEKLDKILNNVIETRIDLYHDKSGKEGNAERCEVTLWLTGGKVLRAEEFAGDMYAAIDLAQETLEKQIRNLKERRISSRNQEKKFRDKIVAALLKTARGFSFTRRAGQRKEGLGGYIVERKRFTSSAKPMTEQEAILQYKLLKDHPFYLFYNADTNRPAVLYRTKDGNFGIVEPNIDKE